MARLVAERGVPVIIMHNREAADPAIDIIADVTAFFHRSLDIAARAGIARERIVLDPGIGFGKTPEQSIACIARLDAWREFGLPLLVGASRKRFIHTVVPSDPTERIGGSLAAHLFAVENGAAIIRAHDVAPTVQALAVAAAIRRAR
jgi:dihydropteroate synthase